MSRLIIASNRLPFSIDTSGEDIQVRQSSGGLVSALKSYFETQGSTQKFSEKIWVGSADFSESDWERSQPFLTDLDFTIEPLFPDSDIYSCFYNGFSNSTIWPLFHYFPSITEYKKDNFEAYSLINRAFANTIAGILEPGDVVWIHDYQLMLVPEMVRAVRPDATIGFFLHIPFPSYEIFRLLPRSWKQELLQGVLGADLVGFHTYDYGQHFVQSVEMVLGIDNNYNKLEFDNRIVQVELFPIGIDFKKFKEMTADTEVMRIHDDYLESFKDKKIIFSVDRLDYTKGLVSRLKSYEQFLQSYPEWCEKVIFIMNIVPSRDVIPTYSDRKREIEETIGTINGRLSTIQWQPIIYRYNHLDFKDLCALYLMADIGLITPIRDGMNLVAKEFVATCDVSGVLILSELTGAASELNEAILVNPTDTEEMAEAIATALKMPAEEQLSRLKTMQKRLENYDVVRWVNDFLDQLRSVKEIQETMKVKVLNDEITERIREDYIKAQRRVILLDYDGTLSPFTRLPSEAKPKPDVLELLEVLSQDSKNEVVIISGRDAVTLESWLGHLNLNFVAEHGVYMKYRDSDWEEQTTVSPDWKNEVRPMLETYVTRCAGSLMEEKKHTLSWHYRNAHPELGFVRSREMLNNLLQLISNKPVQVIDGNKVIEVRLSGLDKGMMARKILNRIQPDFALCIGDDTTDEDMFKAVNDQAYTIKIGTGTTAAQYNIHTQSEVLPFLKEIVTF
ncbi:MAG TPA: bifunctional alpha,alpha-trehalose-phosphate synthase (UDP-forming)/trehalose-phosphatase [Patescibacteria group bacterium]|nr:bifunctional alpha,alpha-trehalose-phosphate synthase (UDP-forming)/trehalose-phosphatase [Patescibacteria group bacterium]